MSDNKNSAETGEKISPAQIVERTTIADVYRADKQLAGIVKKTKLIASDFFSELSGNEVFLKPENMQHTGAFKLRGAYNKISQLTDAERAKGVITSSAGNHAQGVALSAQKNGIKSSIFIVSIGPTPRFLIETMLSSISLSPAIKT